MKQSKLFGADTPNIPTFTSDCVFHFYSPASQASISIYHDNGTAGQDAHIYVPWDTTGASDINLGHSTQATPIEIIGVLAGTYYARCLYRVSGGLYFNLYSGEISVSDQAGAYEDGSGFWVLFMSNSSSTAITVQSGGTTNVAANGGVNWMVNQ